MKGPRQKEQSSPAQMWDHLGWLRKQTQVVYLGVWEAESAGKEGGKVGRSQAREAVYAPEAQTSLLRTWVRSHCPSA